MTKKSKIIILVVIIILFLIPIGVFASNNLYIKLVEYKDNARQEALNEIEKNNNISNNSAQTKKENVFIDENLEEKIKKSEQESLERDNKILEIVNKYLPNKLKEIYSELNGNSIYDTNKELEYKFYNIILDIIETKDINTEERKFLLEYMDGQSVNVKDDVQLYNRIKNVCR